MKKLNQLLIGLTVCFFLYTATAFTQNKAEESSKPMYIVITTAHWNSNPDTDFSDWKKTEEEYFNKVTKKNNSIVGSGVYTHYFSPDNSEVIFVSVYKNWEDIEKANEATAKLIEQGWPDEDARKVFFEKQRSYYSPMHSDEIYTSLPYGKEVKTTSTEPLLFYVRKNTAGQGGNGYKEFFENIILKNKYIKGYFTHRHGWGSDSRDAVEIGVYDNLGDIELAFKENERLINAYWPDEEKRKAFFKDFRKYFARHGDAIYKNVPELDK